MPACEAIQKAIYQRLLKHIYVILYFCILLHICVYCCCCNMHSESTLSIGVCQVPLAPLLTPTEMPPGAFKWSHTTIGIDWSTLALDWTITIIHACIYIYICACVIIMQYAIRKENPWLMLVRFGSQIRIVTISMTAVGVFQPIWWNLSQRSQRHW